MGNQNFFLRFFGVWLRGQTYLNLVYLILAFPLGLAYFIFFVVGLALGLPLTILLVGFAILAFVALGWWVFAQFERQLAIWLLRVRIPPMDKPGAQPVGIWEKFTVLLTNPVTWKSLIFLIVKFPLGILSFIALVLFGGISLALLVSPLTFWWMPITIELAGQSSWAIDTPVEALVGFIIGIFLAIISLHVLNYLAYVSALWAQLMLGNPRPEPEAVRPAAAPTEPSPVAFSAEPEAVFIPGPALEQVPEYPEWMEEPKAETGEADSDSEPGMEPAGEKLPAESGEDDLKPLDAQ
jgi:hypothetical protein